MSRPAQRSRRRTASLRKGITSAASPSPSSSTSAASVVAELTASSPREDRSGEGGVSGTFRAPGFAPHAKESIVDLPGRAGTADEGQQPSQASSHTSSGRNTGHSGAGDKASNPLHTGQHPTIRNDDDPRNTAQHFPNTASHQRNARSVRPTLNTASSSAMRPQRPGESTTATLGIGGGRSGKAASIDASSSPTSGSSRFTPSPHTAGQNVSSDAQYLGSMPARPTYSASSEDPIPPQGETLGMVAPHYPASQGSAYLSHPSLAPFPPQAHQHLHQQAHHQHPGYPSHVAQHSPYAAFHPPPPASPSSVQQQQYTQAMGTEATQQPHSNYGFALRSMSNDASGVASSHAPARAVSPAGSQHDVSAEPYVYAYMAGSDPASGHHPYYPAGPLAPGFAPGQYASSNLYAMQYFSPYSQPAYYSARPHAWMPSLTAAQQQGWQRPPYYPAYLASGQPAPQTAYQHRSPMPQSMHGRPRAPVMSPHLSSQRGTGGSSRASSSNNVPSTQRSVSSSYATSAPDNARQSRAPSRTAITGGVNNSQQSLQGQGPRSEHVLWCGNVPADANLDELWAFFSRLPPAPRSQQLPLEGTSEDDAQGVSTNAERGTLADVTDDQSHGVLSIFVIARSNCAFVNYSTPQHLQRALDFFQGQSLRPHDARCPKLVCRVRKKDDEAQAGVAGQRGRGIHVAWLKEQERMAKEDRQAMSAEEAGVDLPGQGSQPAQQNERYDELHIFDMIAANAEPRNVDDKFAPPTSTPAPIIVREASTPTPQKSGILLSSSQPRPSMDSSSGSGSVSYASTNSSLFRHPAFHERFFILKSSHVKDLDRSVETGMWATQPHNEAVLDQAYRNSENVYLIFSANQSGGFYGYARMNGTIHPTPERTGTARPFPIPEHDESTANDVQMPPTPMLDGALPIRPPVASPVPMSADGKSPPGPVESAAATTIPALSPGSSSSKNGQSHVRNTHTLMPQSGQSRTSARSLDSKRHAEAMEDEASSNQMITVSPLSIEESDPFKNAQYANTAERISINSAFSEPLQTSSRNAQGRSSSSETPSISPWESASYPSDTRSQSQLAIRALIHNLRLDAKESVHRAKQLEAVEAEMKAQEVAGDVSSNGSSGGGASGGLAGDQSSDALDRAPIVIKPQPLASSPETWGKPFKVEWIKVRSLSFSQVRTLRNPWRDNRQVKVSRDGTELEPHVGRRLLEYWTMPSDPDARRESGDAQSNLSSLVDDEEEDIAV